MASASDFDFWVGDWTVRWSDEDGGGHGRNVIEKSFDGRVVQERFDGRPGVELLGMSVNVFDRHRERWLQTWVDDSGNYFHLEGGMVGGAMELLCDRHNAQPPDACYRMRFFDIEPGSLTWTWERSADGGSTYDEVWRIAYERNA